MPLDRQQQAFFTERLLDWYDPSDRPLPWKHISDPYLIWLSEIILQQTRVEQGRAYYDRFRTNYPTVLDLAKAPEDEVMKLWEGLGYYSRARNLMAAAKHIAFERDGQFPHTYEEILALKGVGPYTAAAIASFAFDLPKAVVDGNVFRLLARFTNDDTPIDSSGGKRRFNELAQALLPPHEAARYNQAIMDFGATICKPRQPLCDQCPLQTQCSARQAGRVLELPVKAKRIKRRTRYFQYLVCKQNHYCLIHKRSEKDIWQDLYEFPLLETAGELNSWAELSQHSHWPAWLHEATPSRRVGPQKQDLSHQRIVATFWEFENTPWPQPLSNNFMAVELKNLRTFAFPKIIDWYLSDKTLYLF